jgi:hypothetical protein
MGAQQLTVADLQRWVEAGAHWRVLAAGEHHVTVELCSCLGEPVERLESEAPEVLDYLRGLRSDLDLT